MCYRASEYFLYSANVCAVQILPTRYQNVVWSLTSIFFNCLFAHCLKCHWQETTRTINASPKTLLNPCKFAPASFHTDHAWIEFVIWVTNKIHESFVEQSQENFYHSPYFPSYIPLLPSIAFSTFWDGVSRGLKFCILCT